MTAKKSGTKTGNATTFKPGADPRRGRGPAKGAKKAGRPASEVKAAYLNGASDLLPELLRLARHAKSEGDRIRAIDVLCRNGGLNSVELEIVRPVAMVIEGLE